MSVDMITTVRRAGTDPAFWVGYLNWTDGVSGETMILTSIDARFLGSKGGGRSFAFSAKAGKPVKFLTTADGDPTGSSYDVFLVIERLTKIPNF